MDTATPGASLHPGRGRRAGLALLAFQPPW
jgi:hypothetical protein